MADDPKEPSNRKPESEVTDLGMALTWIGIGCVALAWFLGQRECYVYFTCSDQQTQVGALVVLGVILLAVGLTNKKSV